MIIGLFKVGLSLAWDGYLLMSGVSSWEFCKSTHKGFFLYASKIVCTTLEHSFTSHLTEGTHVASFTLYKETTDLKEAQTCGY